MNKHRHSIRLKKYDYSQSGLYFVTICTQNRENLFGNIVGANHDSPVPKMVLNEFGKIVNKKINELKKYKNVDIDIYCVMPNHIHLILIIVGAGPCACPSRVRPNGLGSTQGSTPTVGEYVKRLKTITTRIYIENVNNKNWPPFNKRLFQRNYYEHIIRNEIELNKIREYIINNPSMWDRDRNNPINIKHL